MQFKNVTGHSELKLKLTEAVNDSRISHSIMFTGPEGTGKLQLAIAWAQYILCTGEKEKDSCGKCPSCIKFKNLVHPDLHFVFPVNKTKSNTKDNPVSDSFIKEWRKFITDNYDFQLSDWLNYIGIENKQGIISVHESASIFKKMSYKTYEGEYKIMIIWLPEFMNDSASNKLLKLLEEPPDKTLFILISEQAENLLPTIISRTQIIKIPGLEEKTIMNCLVEKYNVKEENAFNIARVADGNLVYAIDSVKSSEEYEYNIDTFINIMRLAYSFNAEEIDKLVNDIYSLGRVKQKALLKYSLHAFRNNFLKNKNISKLSKMTEKEAEFANKFSQFITSENIFQIEKEINDAYYHIERNAYAKIIFFDMIIKLNKLLKNK